jgi:RNA polymerase sigma-70 factor (ECF subfamily)
VNEYSPASYEQHDPDVRLMLEVREGNEAAFEELVGRYQSRLVSVMGHLVPKRGEAEDLAQEVFLRVYRARQQYEPTAKFSTWLFTIANNVAFNARRSLARRREVSVTGRSDTSDSDRSLEQIAKAASGLMPGRLFDRVERAEVVRQAIDTLNDRQRLAVILAKFEGMSYAEIGEAMGLSVQATKSLLCRARENLRVILEPYMQDGIRPSEEPDRG